MPHNKGHFYLYIYIPLQNHMENTNTKPPEKTIIVAEDTASNFQLIKAYLKKTDINILWAKNGAEAIDILSKEEKIDLILMDIQMPVMDGIDAIEQIRKEGNQVPIIVQTAFSLSGEIEKSHIAGCNDCITKPIRKDELLSKIFNYL